MNRYMHRDEDKDREKNKKEYILSRFCSCAYYIYINQQATANNKGWISPQV